jgi:thioredoxin reductase (NADPH)
MYDILILGAGPAGISMAAEARAAGIDASSILILEKAHEHSFSIKKYYPESKLVTANYKGVDAICTGVMCITNASKRETVSYLDTAINDTGAAVHYGETVSSIERRSADTSFIVTTDAGVYESRVVAIAIGILGKPNKPEYRLPHTLKARILFDLTSVPVENADVLVVGGGDSASEYCQYLVQKGNRVALSYRRNEFSRMNRINAESLLALADADAVTIQYGSNITSVTDAGGKPQVAYSGDAFETKTYDYVVYALGGTTPQNFLKTIGIEFIGDGPHIADGFETNIPGMFLIGDLSAGAKGGSINWAFNTSNSAMRKICSEYLGCGVETR